MANMPIVPLFLFKLSVSLAVVWCFYQIVLRRLTFYTLNRWYLLGYTLLSFIIPFINIGAILPDGPAGEPVVIQFIPAIGGMSQRATIQAVSGAGLSGWSVVLWVLTTGAAVMLARVAIRWISLVRLRRKARPIEGNGVKIYQVDGPVTPFSFGNAIYINQHLHTEKEWADIILHEYVHIRQRHTIDILLTEMVCIVNWYNPFAWLIRYSVRQNLEFVADQQVLDKGVDRKGYQYHLLKVVGEPRYRLANNFNFSSLKKRIIMMNKMRSTRVHLLKLLFLLPLVSVLLVAFRDQGAKLFGPHGPVYVNVAGIVINSPDRKPLERVVVREQTTGLETKTDVDGFYEIHIPVKGKSVSVDLEYTKPGYDTDHRAWNMPDVKVTTGILDVGLLRQPNAPRSNLFIAPTFVKAPVDPEFTDAKEELRLVLKQSDDLNQFMKLQKDHPEIGLFYETEDKRKEIVIYMDGTIERYGYPGTAGLDELYKKYGKIDGFMASDHPEGHQVNSGYLARWAAIGEQAQREFHPANPNFRAVIFPGDSRVIVVPLSGKPRYFDMDNDDSHERLEFEQLYGKLPDCVPEAGNKPHDSAPGGGKVALRAVEVKDTVPGNRDSTRQSILVIGKGSSDTLRNKGKRPGEMVTIVGRSNGPLFLINGREVPADTLQKINPDSIASIDVMKDPVNENSPMYAKYGDRVKDGVVVIHMKSEKAPYCLVDGRVVSWDSVQRMHPADIESMNVLKPEQARATYGEKGKNGVVLITLRPKGTGN